MKILFLAHRIPFPPNKGDKIRSFHEIKFLSLRHELHLLSFYEEANEAAYGDDIRNFCKTVDLIPLDRRRQQARALLSMFKSQPWTLGYFSCPRMWAAVRQRLSSTRFDAIFAYSSAMAPYVVSDRTAPKFLDFVDSDAGKWLQYARFTPAPKSWLFSYEARNLLRFEQKMAQKFDASIFVSPREAGHLTGPEYRDRIHFVQNGIDLDHFAGAGSEGNSQTIIFTGAMDYFPNIDAVSFFAREIFPLVRASHPDARFVIVGRTPAPEVRRLGALPGVQVTGTVPDVRPFLSAAKVAVVPVRISQGIQNKILEALAAGLPVVTTSSAALGLTSTEGLPLAIEDDPAAYAARVSAFLKAAPAKEQVSAARSRLKQEYDWDTNLSALEHLIEEKSASFFRNSHS